MVALIKSVGKRELMREARIAMRTIYAVWAGLDVADDDLARMADAAGRIVALAERRDSEKVAGIEWLKAKRDFVGLAMVAKLFEMDTANLRSVINGKRHPSRTLLIKLKRHLSIV